MVQHPASTNPDPRRASVRRTVWIVAAVALAIYLMFFLEKGLGH
jgi:hypothetical protein